MSIDAFIVQCIHLTRMISLSRWQLPRFQFLLALPDPTTHFASIPSMSEMLLGRGSCPRRPRFILILILILIVLILIVLILIVLILIVLILIVLILIVLILIILPVIHNLIL